MESINWIQIPAEFEVSIIQSRRTTLKSRPGMESIIDRNKTNRKLTSAFPWKKICFRLLMFKLKDQPDPEERLVLNFRHISSA